MTRQPDRHDRLWQCAVCKEWFVVPTLARLCEMKHRAERT